MSAHRSRLEKILSVVVESVCWLLPIGLIWLGHTLGWLKVDQRFIIVNERTTQAERIWHFVDDHFWAVGIYSLLLLGCMATLRLRGTSAIVRAIFLAVLSLPALYYFSEMGFLAGKFIEW